MVEHIVDKTPEEIENEIVRLKNECIIANLLFSMTKTDRRAAMCRVDDMLDILDDTNDVIGKRAQFAFDAQSVNEAGDGFEPGKVLISVEALKDSGTSRVKYVFENYAPLLVVQHTEPPKLTVVKKE